MLCFPASGHINPFVCYGSELAKNKNIKLIMYCNKQFQNMIEAANIEFRNIDVEYPSDKISVSELRNQMPIHKVLGAFMETIDLMLPEFIRCIEEENIDLIIYDFMSVHAKWLLKYLRIQYEKGKLKRPPPKALMFGPSLLHQKGIYPNSYEQRFLPNPKISLGFLYNMIVFFIKYSLFCFKYHLPIENPINLLFYTKEELNIVCIVPEFQPRAHLYPKNVKFVGNCAS